MIERKFPKEWTEYKIEVDRLKQLLDDPQEGLTTWTQAVLDTLNKINTMYIGVELNLLLKDAYFSGFSEGADVAVNQTGYWRWEPRAEFAFNQWLKK